jgi:hypothetical protein
MHGNIDLTSNNCFCPIKYDVYWWKKVNGWKEIRKLFSGLLAIINKTVLFFSNLEIDETVIILMGLIMLMKSLKKLWFVMRILFKLSGWVDIKIMLWNAFEFYYLLYTHQTNNCVFNIFSVDFSLLSPFQSVYFVIPSFNYVLSKSRYLFLDVIIYPSSFPSLDLFLSF